MWTVLINFEWKYWCLRRLLIFPLRSWCKAENSFIYNLVQLSRVNKMDYFVPLLLLSSPDPRDPAKFTWGPIWTDWYTIANSPLVYQGEGGSWWWGRWRNEGADECYNACCRNIVCCVGGVSQGSSLNGSHYYYFPQTLYYNHPVSLLYYFIAKFLRPAHPSILSAVTSKENPKLFQIKIPARLFQ